MSDKFDREAGIQAIIWLQKQAEIIEPRERAERNWDNFSDTDKAKTMAAYEMMGGPEVKSSG